MLVEVVIDSSEVANLHYETPRETLRSVILLTVFSHNEQNKFI